jgi:hypothetical protein
MLVDAQSSKSRQDELQLSYSRITQNRVIFHLTFVVNMRFLVQSIHHPTIFFLITSTVSLRIWVETFRAYVREAALYGALIGPSG